MLVYLGYRSIAKYWLKGGAKGIVEESRKPSTQAFLGVVDDLRQIKFERDPGETPREIVSRVTRLINEMEQPDGLTQLPPILAEFMDKYAANRFIETELPELRAEIDEIGNKIHVILTSRAK